MSESSAPDLTLDRAKIGTWLKEARMRFNLTLRELARRSTVSHSQILRCESGEFGMSVDVLVQLASELGMPVGLLIETARIPSWNTYLKPLLADSFLQALTERHRLTSKTSAELLPRFVACSAAFLEHLLLSSNACRWVANVEFPFRKFELRYASYAEFIDGHFGPVERSEGIETLKADPFRTLHGCGICDEAMIVEFLKGKPSGSFTWNPFAKETVILGRGER